MKIEIHKIWNAPLGQDGLETKLEWQGWILNSKYLGQGRTVPSHAGRSRAREVSIAKKIFKFSAFQYTYIRFTIAPPQILSQFLYRKRRIENWGQIAHIIFSNDRNFFYHYRSIFSYTNRCFYRCLINFDHKLYKIFLPTKQNTITKCNTNAYSTSMIRTHLIFYR